MSSFELSDAATWGGEPVAHTVATARPRGRVVVTGTIRATRVVDRGSGPAYRCTLDDGTGQLDLVFVGRRVVPGLRAGVRCTVEGTILGRGGRLEVWNPRYRIEAKGGDCRTGH